SNLKRRSHPNTVFRFPAAARFWTMRYYCSHRFLYIGSVQVDRWLLLHWRYWMRFHCQNGSKIAVAMTVSWQILSFGEQEFRFGDSQTRIPRLPSSLRSTFG